MTPQQLEQQTYLPEADEVAGVLNFLKVHEAARGSTPAPRYFLAGPDLHEHIELPESVYRVLRQVVEAMSTGKAVTVAPQSTQLTTQQAADLLGVSRPTVVKLIEEGTLPAETPGKRRRLVKLDDLLTYRARRREEQYRALLETSDDYEGAFEGAQAAETALRQVRAEVAAARRERTSHPRRVI